MTETITKLVHWYNTEFKTTDMFAEMTTTVEGSPWHREANVGVHTDMVFSMAVSYARQLTSTTDVAYLLLATAFHDTGKPIAEEVRRNDMRGVYRRYAGHEKQSARIWERFAVRNIEFLNSLGLTEYDVYGIGWLIEHHLPYGVKKTQKLNTLHTTLERLDKLDVFCAMLRSDSYGRISDDHEAKIDNMETWIEEFRSTHTAHVVGLCKGVDRPKLTVLIGASCSGKSTYISKMDDQAAIFSMDQLRLDWYDSADYTNAYKMSTEDKQFKPRVNENLMDMLNSGLDVISDNINVTVKSRAHAVNTARNKGYIVEAVLFLNDDAVLVERIKHRAHQHVPTEAILGQYRAVTYPSYVEFDKITVILPSA